MLSLYHQFEDFTEQFLEPLIQHCRIESRVIPLAEMTTWQQTPDGNIKNPFFRVEGRRTQIDLEADGAAAHSWDQPLYKQDTGSLVLVIDERNNIVVRGVFEPGNTERGYKNKGLILCTTSKFSPGNLAHQRAQGKTVPFSDVMHHEQAEVLVTAPAPGDGARADKQNIHQLVRLPGTAIEQVYEALPTVIQPQYALITREVFKEAYHRGLVGEHLRDLSSLLLFL